MTGPEDATRIDVDQYFPHSPATVWKALTTPSLMARWLMMPNGFEPVVGTTFTFQTRPVARTAFSGRILCRVLDLVPQERLRISWRDEAQEGAETTVTWTLQPEGRGTRLFIEHAGFAPDDPVQQLARTIMGGGWRSHILRRLGDLLPHLDD